MRLLSERPDHDRQGAARQEQESQRRRDSRGHVADTLPLHDLLPYTSRDQADCEGDRMRTKTNRRDFLKSSGMLVVGFSSIGGISIAQVPARSAAAGAGNGPYPDVDFKQLDSWIVIRPDNTATFYVGKTDCGQGTGTAFRQMMSDELDIAYDKTTCIMGT